MERVYRTGGTSGMNYTQILTKLSKEKEAKRKMVGKTAFNILWIMPRMWKLMDNSLIKRLVELSTITTSAWTTPSIIKTVGVAHINHNTTTTNIGNLKTRGLKPLYLNLT